MELSFDTIPILLATGSLIFLVYYMGYRNFIYSIIDPLFLWIILTAFGTVLCIEVIPEKKDLIHFIGCQLFLWFGFLIAYKPYRYKHEFYTSDTLYQLSNIKILQVVTYCFCSLYLLSNIIIAWNKGFALLSDTPTESKIADFQNGFGFFRKLNWTIGTFSLISLIFLYIERTKNIYIFLFLIIASISIFDGSKAAFLKIIISVGIIIYHPYFRKHKAIISKISRYIPLVSFCSLSIVYIVLSKENENSNDILAAFLKRLLFSADSILFYYQPINIEFFKNYDFLDYLVRITNPILGFLRIQSYEETVGNIMVDNLRPPGSSDYVTVGPNAPFYIESRIYFNYWVAFPYSAMIGFLYAKLRTYYFSIKRANAYYFIYIATNLQLLDAIIVDTNLAVVQIFGMFMYVHLPYLLIKFFLTGKIHLKLPALKKQ